jgi:hypothetical protein
MTTLSKSQRGSQTTKTGPYDEDREDGLCVAGIAHFETEILQDSVLYVDLVENYGVSEKK